MPGDSWNINMSMIHGLKTQTAIYNRRKDTDQLPTSSSCLSPSQTPSNHPNRSVRRRRKLRSLSRTTRHLSTAMLPRWWLAKNSQQRRPGTLNTRGVSTLVLRDIPRWECALVPKPK